MSEDLIAEQARRMHDLLCRARKGRDSIESAVTTIFGRHGVLRFTGTKVARYLQYTADVPAVLTDETRLSRAFSVKFRLN